MGRVEVIPASKKRSWAVILVEGVILFPDNVEALPLNVLHVRTFTSVEPMSTPRNALIIVKLEVSWACTLENI